MSNINELTTLTLENVSSDILHWPNLPRLDEQVEATKTTTRDIVRMLERCGQSLVEPDLDVSRFAFYRRHEWLPSFDGFDWKRALDFRSRHWLPVSAYRLSNALSKHCPALRALDLTNLAVDGRAMLALAHGIGPQLVNLRLKNCFVDSHSDDSDTRLDPSPEEWDALLLSAQNLRHLDISENLFFGKKLSFCSVSRKLETFRSYGAYLSSKQLTKMAQRAQQLRTLAVDDLFSRRGDGLPESVDSDGEEVYSAFSFPEGKVRHILGLLSGLKVLWLKEFCSCSSIETSTGTMAPLFRQSSGTSLLELLFPHQPMTNTGPTSVELSKVCVTSERFSSAQLAAFGRSTMAHCTTLSFTLCATLDDSALAQIAALGHAQSLTVLFCENITWRGLAAFLDCKEMCHLEAVEQMTDELLALVQSTMDKRLMRLVRGRPRRFQFIRHRPEIYYTAKEIADGEMVPRNTECAQTASQNMHPGVLFHAEDAEWRSETEHDLADKFIVLWGVHRSFISSKNRIRTE